MPIFLDVDCDKVKGKIAKAKCEARKKKLEGPDKRKKSDPIPKETQELLQKRKDG